MHFGRPLETGCSPSQQINDMRQRNNSQVTQAIDSMTAQPAIAATREALGQGFSHL